MLRGLRPRGPPNAPIIVEGRGPMAPLRSRLRQGYVGARPKLRAKRELSEGGRVAQLLPLVRVGQPNLEVRLSGR